jgi:hypothetical protein
MRLRTLSLYLVAAALPVLGCSEAPPADEPPVQPPAPQPAQLVTTLTLAEGHTVQFWDASSAAIVVMEQGSVNGTPLMRKHAERAKNAVELYKALAPTQRVPSTLLDAQLRADDFWRVHPRRPGAPKATEGVSMVQQPVTVGPSDGNAPNAGDGTVDQLCPGSWFKANFCDWFSTSWASNGCNLRKINGGYGYSVADVNDTWSTVCSYRGNTHFRAWHRTWWSWSYIGETKITEGRWHDVWTFQTSADYDYEEQVLTTDGIGYHRTLHWK